ncbi:MAG: hypothetical protein CMJ58_11665 [Planctomycetaceae bacterium]|nr:hypothetical protein [Planctomycetaceae bacterium]
MNCQTCRELLDEYVLGHCDPADAAAMDEHLANCTACRDEAAAVEAAWSALPAGAEPTTPPPHLRQRVRDALDSPHPPVDRGTPAPSPPASHAAPTVDAAAATVLPGASGAHFWSYALAASVFLALTVGSWWYVNSHRDQQAQVAATNQRDAAKLAERLGRLMRAEGATPTQQFTLTPSGGQAGVVQAAWDGVTGQWHVYALDLPAAPAGEAYRLWFVDEAGAIWGRGLDAAAKGVLSATAKPPAPPEQLRQILVTLEPTPVGDAPTGLTLWRSELPHDDND